MKILILAAALTMISTVVFADDDDSDIVTGCLMSNAEFGSEMAQICINENKAARAEVQRYPVEHKGTVDRCSRRKGMGWGIVKKCIDDDIAALPILEAYARDHADLVEKCESEFWGRERSRIKICVEHALEADQAPAGK
ncbi:MAG: hypothetical protein ABI619_03250 [Betaproteobacteria bacterium]